MEGRKREERGRKEGKKGRRKGRKRKFVYQVAI
jgi:hypothetical protein